MLLRKGLWRVAALLPALALGAEEAAEDGDDGVRRIEEVTVTAERRESTVQDTAISITAFTGEFIENFGLRNQEDLQQHIPATTIQPYDLSIRGVGRLFRSLGGDPGIATYYDNAFSEDFGIASTEGGLFDVERIEVLRGPQGTLYGRNGIGGAVNFHTKRPTQEFESEIRAIYGSYDTQEMYGVISGPMIQDILAYRAVASKRTRDGFIPDIGTGPDGSPNEDINSWGDENYALSFLFTPTDNLEIYVRGNERSYRRAMSGAQGAGAIIYAENGGRRDDVTGDLRNTSAYVFGYRPVNPNSAACASLTDRTDPLCPVAGRQIFTYDYNGITRHGQRLVPGVDRSEGRPIVDASGNITGVTTGNGFSRPSYAFFSDPNQLNRTAVGDGQSVPELSGDDLVSVTNGYQDEYFDQQAGTTNITWDVNDWLSVKYIGNYTDYFYHRTTEDDRTGSLVFDQQFYAAQEKHEFQHELQIFTDIGSDITVTSGLFYYQNDIDQQLDFWGTGPASDTRYTHAADYGPVGADTLLAGVSGFYLGEGFGTVEARSAENLALFDLVGVVPTPQFSDATLESVLIAVGPWSGERGRVTDGSPHGSNGTTFIWDSENRTEALAAYTQAEWQINERWALTAGMRYAKDRREGVEHLFLYQEYGAGVANMPDYGCGGGTLCDYNIMTGALNPDGTLSARGISGEVPVRVNGIPFSQSLYRRMFNDFDNFTWRFNIDWTPADDQLFYLSTTTGYRSGGFNLGYFSFIPSYESEDILAYELGYKGQLFDGTMQVNLSLYRYDYENVHLQFTTSTFTGNSTSVRNAPEATTTGLEADILWLATPEITFGFSYSYTNAEYTGEVIDPLTGNVGVIELTNADAPESLYTNQELLFPVNGRSLPRIMENKLTAWAEYVQSLGERGSITYMTNIGLTDEFAPGGRPRVNGPLDLAPSYIRWDARVTWESADEKWSVAGFLNNITDELGVRNSFNYGESMNYLRVLEPTNPRMGGIEVRYKL